MAKNDKRSKLDESGPSRSTGESADFLIGENWSVNEHLVDGPDLEETHGHDTDASENRKSNTGKKGRG